jgi:putative transposase
MTTREVKAEVVDIKGLLARDEDFVRSAVEALVQAALEAEMTEAIGAAKGERSDTRISYRSGYYARSLITRVGTLELRVPQDRMGRFSTELFERYQRSEKALVGTLAEMYVQGVSTRKVKAVTEALCGHSFSASSISGINKSLDEGLRAFAERRLSEPFPYLILDARYEKVREAGIIVSQAVLVAVAVDGEGRRQVLAAGGRARQPREPFELARFSLGPEEARPRRRRVCCLGQSRGPEGSDPRSAPRGGLAALLRAFSAQRSRLCAATGR